MCLVLEHWWSYESAFLNSSIYALKLNDEIYTKLINNDILTILNLWNLNRKQLKKMKFTDNELNQIVIKMQLHGFDLNKRIYSKD